MRAALASPPRCLVTCSVRFSLRYRCLPYAFRRAASVGELPAAAATTLKATSVAAY